MFLSQTWRLQYSPVDAERAISSVARVEYTGERESVLYIAEV